ncbi:MAG: NAD(P)H-dependent oxidoreductase [Ignavibacteriales bacterium]|nr:NAD(P)H-dependent oxidoreductase [Ignavibacteriales bacterium]
MKNHRVNKRLIRDVKSINNITLNDLYEEYYDFNIDVEREKKLLVEHDIIIFHHPFFWYSTPALLKQWEDLVLEHGWAYGSKGTALGWKKVDEHHHNRRHHLRHILKKVLIVTRSESF